VAAFAREPFDVVLMDVQMPDMDGLAAAAAIRAQERPGNGRIPIIALTAHTLSGDRERCLQAGMDAYLAKPLRPREVFEIIENLHPPAAVNPERDALLARVEGDRALLQKMAQAFTRQAETLLAEIRAAGGRGDGPALERAAHKLRGSVANFGSSPAGATAHQLETLGRSADLARWEELCVRLEDDVAHLGQALAALCREGER
jgi:CheY-like chemotaxis protein